MSNKNEIRKMLLNQSITDDSIFFKELDRLETEVSRLRAEVVRLKRFSGFGESIWNWVTGLANDFFCFEESEDIMEIAQRHGLAESVAYDPDKHGDLGAERGDKVWYWGKNRTRASEGGEKGRE